MSMIEALAAQTPAENKAGRRCVCGERKFAGRPFCLACWTKIPASLQEFSKLDHAATFSDIVAFLSGVPNGIEFDPLPESAQLATPEAPQLTESPAKALAMVGFAEAELDRVFLGASIDLKAIAIQALLEYDQHRTPA